LGLFCETIRLFLSTLKVESPQKFDSIPVTLRRRYLKDDGKETRFGDAPSKETRRRLAVCARDVWRLVDRFRGDGDVQKLEAYGLLERLLGDQCDVVEAPVPGEEGDADISEPGAPVTVKEPKEVRPDSLQTPHDPDVTYSGHKGKGYEVQIAETHGNENLPEIITHVEVTRSCDSDDQATIPTVEALAERKIQPEEMVADTTYSSTENVIECGKRGTELVSPVAGSEAEPAKDGEMRKGDFAVDPKGEQKTTCPAGHAAAREERNAERGTVRAFFDGNVCGMCDKRDACPARKLIDGTRVLSTTEKRAVLEQRRSHEKTSEFAERYAKRAGIEATNSELKRRHGLGRIRTRGSPRVRLAVYLKAAACNVKRMLVYLVNNAIDAAKEAPAPIQGAARTMAHALTSLNIAFLTACRPPATPFATT